ncbi:MAG: TlyA family rRNA (cytidine-2'-O)-methyltransferase [Bradymonadales bacterium]|nr:MAG: TlyA family rRNA (cytidine-2'-O)-methyltransferase [Bradymonadales bacterium]
MRLDQWLFEEGYFESREKARREILVGRVREKGSGEVLDKPGQRVKSGLQVQILAASRFVSRGGEKLAGFLDETGLQTEGYRCLDVGSSTGGFTDCLLQRGAQSVVAVDVGSHQLHEKLRKDPRVELFENQDVRHFSFESGASFDLSCVDCSFISLRKLLPSLIERLRSKTWIMLFKPQFEVGRGVRMPRGVVPERAAWKCLEEMLLFLDSLGFNSLVIRESQVRGTKGNQEVFIQASIEKQQGRDLLHIFRTYDIRGRAGTELTPQLMRGVGKVLVRRLLSRFPKEKKLRVGLGRDQRPSSPELARALQEGLQHPALELFWAGEVATPSLYFGSQHFSWHAAFQVTASHNPTEDNGLKMLINGQALFGDEIRGIGLEVLARAPELEAQPGELPLIDCHEELQASYLKFLHSDIQLDRKFRVAVDCGNGMGGVLARRALEPFCDKLEILFETVDCRFPNHPADPSVGANMQDLVALMKKDEFDVGFAFDGDADRVGVVTRQGRILWGDEILMLLAEKVLKEKPGSVVIGEVKCSQKLFQMIRDRGGQPVMYRAGHSLMKKRLKELEAPIAGEMSGHLFFGDRFFGFDDGIYAALRVLEVMAVLHLDLDEWINSFPEMTSTPEIRVHCPEDQKQAWVEKIKGLFEKDEGAELNLIDGVRVSFPDQSWVLARASNTEAAMVFRIEALTPDRLEELRARMEKSLGVLVRV